MTTLPRTMTSPRVAPPAAPSAPDSSTTHSSPEVSSSTPVLALITARSAGARSSCSGSGADTVMNGAVSVSPYTWVTSQPNSPSSRSIVGPQPAGALLADQLDDQRRVDLAQAHVRPGGGGHRPGEGPPVGVEHRQRPQVAVADAHGQVQQGADGVHRGVAVRDHDALGPGRGAARVVDGEQVALADLRLAERGTARRDQRL